jgi:hypothetical protein
MTTIGTCSKCGGPVCMPEFWGGVTPPTPQCANCKAVPVNPFGPRIEMGDAPDPKWIMREKEITPEDFREYEKMYRGDWSGRTRRMPE